MSNFLNDLLIWIEANLYSNLRLNDVALKSGYSKWYLQRLFQEATGISLGKYMRNRKITNAALLLKLSKLSIVDICEETGFSSQQTFTRFFRKYFGVTPGEYRNQDFISFSSLQGNLLREHDFVPNVECINDFTVEYNDVLIKNRNLVISQRNNTIDTIFYDKLNEFLLQSYNTCMEYEGASVMAGIPFSFATGYNLSSFGKEPEILIYTKKDIIQQQSGHGRFMRFYFEGNILSFSDFINFIYFVFLKTNKIHRSVYSLDFFSGVLYGNEKSALMKGYYYIPLSKNGSSYKKSGC